MTVSITSFKPSGSTAGSSNGVWTATVQWTVITDGGDGLNDTLADRVMQAVDNQFRLPAEGTPYPGRPHATCRSIKCDWQKKREYKITASYSDENSNGTDACVAYNPLDDCPIILPVAAMETEAMDRDRDGVAVLNAAGDPVLQTREYNIMGFTVTKNVSIYPDYIRDLRDTCNDAPVRIDGLVFEAETVRFILPSRWTSKRKTRNGFAYREINFELKIDEKDKHYGRPMNAGFRAFYPLLDEEGNRVNESGTPLFPDQETIYQRRTIIFGEDGSEPSEPVPLTADTGEVLQNPTPDTVNYLEVKKYPTADYTVLPGVSAA